MSTSMNIITAASYARHYIAHLDTDEGYTDRELLDLGVQSVVDFMVGDLTWDVDVAPHCDEYCL